MNKTSLYALFFSAILLALLLVIWAQPAKSGLNAADSAPELSLPELLIDTRPIDRSLRGDPHSYADMLEQVTPAVVGVFTTHVITTSSQRRHPMEEFYRRYFQLPEQERDENATPGRESESEERRIPTGVGSGVVVSPEGFILTNNHVLTVGRSNRIADEIKVQLTDGREYEATLVGADERTDIAVIKIDVDEPLSYATLADSDLLRVGDVCFAIGNPFQVGLTVTRGIVSGIGRTDMGILGVQGYEDFIQTDAAINMGNSGGALIDAEGRLIGINTAILSRTGGNIGIGFAIPVNMARYIMTSLIDSGTVSRGYLGVVIGNMNADLAESFGLDTSRGALIRQVEEGSAADQAGIRHGDIILKVDGRNINSASELRLSIAQKPPGKKVYIEIFREGRQVSKQVRLGDMDSGLAQINREIPEEKTVTLLSGVVVSPLSSNLKEDHSIPDTVSGLVIESVDTRSAFYRILIPGMVISEVNGTKVSRLSEMEGALADGLNQLYVWYDGVYDFVTVRTES